MSVLHRNGKRFDFVTPPSRCSSQYREKRMEQEKELLKSQMAWLNDELKAKSEELLALSRQKGNEILELKCSLDNKEDEVRRSHRHALSRLTRLVLELSSYRGNQMNGRGVLYS